ncbi:hypothetical protein P7C73_g789, partial [Tremellales sp. Uapishka_1]
MAFVPTLTPSAAIEDESYAMEEKNLDGQASVDVQPIGAGLVDSDKAEARKLFTYEDSIRLKRKADIRLIPLFILLYLVKNIDSNIISYVKTMNKGTHLNILTQLHMTSDQYAYLATTFTVSFALFEVPMNLFIKKATPRVSAPLLGPNLHLPPHQLQFVRIVGIWSIIVGCTAACQNAAGLYVCRFLLGLAEAGLWSGIIYHWYRPDEVATRLALLTMLGQFSGIIDSLLTYGLSYVTHGIAGWRWAFIICGLIGLVVTGMTWLWLPDWPDSPPSRRQFFTQEEGAFMASRLPPNAASLHDMNFDWQAIKLELKSPLLYGFCAINFFGGTGTTGVAFWLPTINAALGLTQGPSAQLLNIPPAVIFVIASILTGLFIDRTVRIPKFVPMITGFAGLIGEMISTILRPVLICPGVFIGLIFAKSPGGRYTLILLSYMFQAMFFVSVWPLRAITIRGSTSSAFMFAFTNMISNLPGLYTAQIFRSKYAPVYAVPFGVCIIFFAAGLLASLFTWYHMYDIEKETRRVANLRRLAGKADGIVIEQDVVVKS